jgi:hypothetical protein
MLPNPEPFIGTMIDPRVFRLSEATHTEPSQEDLVGDARLDSGGVTRRLDRCPSTILYATESIASR